MNEATGPTHAVTILQPGVSGVHFVQETLSMVGDEYALLGYTPTESYSLMVFVDGLFVCQGTGAAQYVVDGRKIQFNTPLSGGEVVTCSYNTTATVAAIPVVTIAFDVPGANVRVGTAGSLQLLVSNGDDPETFSWHDMLPQVHPITGAITYDVVPEISPNQ